jgi:hypothetical protein
MGDFHSSLLPTHRALTSFQLQWEAVAGGVEVDILRSAVEEYAAAEVEDSCAAAEEVEDSCAVAVVAASGVVAVDHTG